jgi:hypothetical protein
MATIESGGILRLTEFGNEVEAAIHDACESSKTIHGTFASDGLRYSRLYARGSLGSNARAHTLWALFTISVEGELAIQRLRVGFVRSETI